MTPGPHWGRLDPGESVTVHAIGPVFSDLAPAMQAFPGGAIEMSGGGRMLRLTNRSPSTVAAFFLCYMKTSLLQELAGIAQATAAVRKEGGR